jgi:hypothetical protein
MRRRRPALETTSDAHPETLLPWRHDLVLDPVVLPIGGDAERPAVGRAMKDVPITEIAPEQIAVRGRLRHLPFDGYSARPLMASSHANICSHGIGRFTQA